MTEQLPEPVQPPRPVQPVHPQSSYPAPPPPPAVPSYPIYPTAPPYSAYPFGYAGAHQTPPVGRGRRGRAVKAGAAATALVAVAGLGFAAGTTRSRTDVVRIPASQGSSTGNTANGDPFGFGGGFSGGSGGSGGFGGSGGSGGFGGSGSGTSGTSGSGQAATTAQQVGIVDIDTNLAYEGAQAAGTGMVLDSGGDVLTNNHVVNGATSIKVTIVSTGKTYTAKVVGTDPTQDIAVVKLSGASGLATANFGNSSTLKVGAAVTGVGNAGGTGGTPSAATGHVVALDQSITAADDGGSNAEKLPDVIVSDAAIEPGDSGGPLYDAQGRVVGIDTAANTSGTAQGFSIPINTARSLAAQILSGNETTAIHIGYPGFLGVSVSATNDGSDGALVTGLLSGGPAAKAGLVAGDVITKVGSARTTSATALTGTMEALQPGQRVAVTYVNHDGHSHTVTVTLATGPAD